MNSKQIIFPENANTKPKIIQEKEKSKRVITAKKQWIFAEEHLHFDNEIKIIKELREPTNEVLPKSNRFVLQQINQKIYGYKSQDIQKDKLSTDELVTIEYVLNLMVETNLECYYCKEKVKVLYEFVRDPKQWSLDRIDNDYGHNRNNVKIACLSCNLRRKTMYHDRYLFTKQIGTIKKLS
jgi:5-methylcytosine-specific restriction endonuclease McrA